MVSLGKRKYKYFIGYKDGNHKIEPLRLLLQKQVFM